MKPICPTRWLTRKAAVVSVIENYENVLTTLKEASRTFGTETGSRASGLYNNFIQGKCLLGLSSSLPILQCLEGFNKTLQGKKQTVDGMLSSARIVKEELNALRTEDVFNNIVIQVEADIERMNLEPLVLPRRRKVPRKFGGGDVAAPVDSAEDMYRHEFFRVIDKAVINIDKYFTSTDLSSYSDLTTMLGNAVYNDVVVQKYPELSQDLKHELPFFRRQFQFNSVSEVHTIFKDMSPDVRKMFPCVERLLRLCLISPASSCTAERSFSALRRLKTWLRNTMTQSRLNHLLICEVHSDRLEEIDDRLIAELFVKNSPDRRVSVFGNF